MQIQNKKEMKKKIIQIDCISKKVYSIQQSNTWASALGRFEFDNDWSETDTPVQEPPVQ